VEEVERWWWKEITGECGKGLARGAYERGEREEGWRICGGGDRVPKEGGGRGMSGGGGGEGKGWGNRLGGGKTRKEDWEWSREGGGAEGRSERGRGKRGKEKGERGG